ncbi:DUF6415 family natural product biosynthesis protein [Streptomyces sp. TRM68416]|uniref:DUF6415 family natural product biosynthesis protein n=1 Tax=Streptomyces sp. TRM68416 TaxID=2758412 RepID=UPI001661F0B1|nr:DUF6415 family natural product biosynthesis protein [Streptomyces sp. TRM68416]MBD0838767.1 hypothetical protein [Streptomyces sp. TRM68416]
MRQATAHPPTAEDQDQAPPDIATMRDVIDRLLDPDVAFELLVLEPDEMETLFLQLRGHIELLVPEVEQAARKLPRHCIPRYCVLACLGEAREKLRAGPAARFGGLPGHARRLARVLNALCDHYEQLNGREH